MCVFPENGGAFLVVFGGVYRTGLILIVLGASQMEGKLLGFFDSSAGGRKMLIFPVFFDTLKRDGKHWRFSIGRKWVPETL